MFTGISWYAYFLMAASLTGTYYLLVLILFYGKAWLSSWKRRLATIVQRTEATSPGATEIRGDHQEEQTAQACVDELTAFFEEAKSTSWSREQLLASLQRILTKYTGINHSEYLPTILRVIITYSDHYCSIRLRKEDLVGLWQEG